LKPWEAIIWISIQIVELYVEIKTVVVRHRVITVVVAIFVLVAGLASQRAHAGMDKFVALGTGSTSGVFYAVGQGICDLVNKRRAEDLVRCIGYRTGGSVFNIQSLISQELDMGMTSSELAYQAYKGEGTFAAVGAAKNLRTVASFYDTPISIMVKKEAEISSFEDFKGKRINIGNKGSGKRAVADLLFNAMKWSRTDFAKVFELPTGAAGKTFCKDKADILIDVLGHPSSFYKKMISQCGGKFIPFSEKIVSSIIKAHPYFFSLRIPGHFYKDTPKEVLTFGSKAILVTRKEIHPKTVFSLLKSIYQNLESFRKKHPALRAITASSATLNGMAIPMHEGAVLFYGEQKKK
jgi:TRAP transporter TAXI family solute receptor